MLRLPAALRLFVLLALLPMTAGAYTRPRYGGTLRIEVQGDAWAVNSIARRMVYDGLTTTNESGEVRPALALRWVSTNNDHRWQFWLRPGVHFHDGSALTVDSVVDGLVRSCTQCPWSALRRSGDSVVFTFNSPAPNLPALLAGGEWLITQPETAGAPPVGTGPFRIASNNGASLLLAAVEDAWAGRPYLDTIEIVGRKAIRSELLDLASGQADLVEVPPELVRQAQAERLRIVQSGPCDLLALVLSRSGPLADDAQRESVAKAIDRAVLANTIYQKQGEVAGDVLPNELSGFAFLFPVARDLTRAQTLHGASGGTPLTLATGDSGATSQLAAERIALNLRDAGFRVQVQPHDAVQASLAPDLRLRRIHLNPVTPGSLLQAAVTALGGTEPIDGEDPVSLYRADASFLANHAVIPLLWLPRAYGVGVRVRGLHLMPDGTPALADVSTEDER